MSPRKRKEKHKTQNTIQQDLNESFNDNVHILPFFVPVSALSLQKNEKALEGMV
jgi:hypothetical protein